jgi:glycosyltransferase involved in cell wall biosynthesis
MRVAIFHNRYIYRGGEDAVVDLEAELLRKAGHEVQLFIVDNRDEIAGSTLKALRAGLRARWNPSVYDRVTAFLTQRPADVGHVHNFFPLLSPAVHAAIGDLRIPVVQTLHNYRLLCANGMFLRRERPCEDCVERGPWNAVRHGCYRGSRLQTAVWAEQTALHRRLGTWLRRVDLFTTPSEFARRKLLAAGLPPDRVVVKPNPAADPGKPTFGGRGAVFAGRICREKGVHLLLEAWRSQAGHPLTIVGTGPAEVELRRRAADIPGVRFLGQLDRDGVYAALRGASFAVVPSIWYENSPVAVAEAMACGRATVAAHPTALGEFVEHGRTGLLFESGDVVGLADACRSLLADPARAEAMGREARAYYEDRLTLEASLARLVALYERAAALRAQGAPGGAPRSPTRNAVKIWRRSPETRA